jgi:hypothetical protein
MRDFGGWHRVQRNRGSGGIESVLCSQEREKALPGIRIDQPISYFSHCALLGLSDACNMRLEPDESLMMMVVRSEPKEISCNPLISYHACCLVQMDVVDGIDYKLQEVWLQLVEGG